MQSSLALTALLMGLAGGPHCVAMCGAACAGIAQAAGPHQASALWGFQAGRVLGYSALGGLSAASMQGLGWLTVQSAALRPVWSFLHIGALALGLLLLFKAQQPVWLERAGRKIWAQARQLAAGRGRGMPVIVGALWTISALWPSVLGPVGGSADRAGLAGRGCDGALCLGQRRFDGLWALALAAPEWSQRGRTRWARPRRWRLGCAIGRPGAGQQCGVGSVDGPGP